MPKQLYYYDKATNTTKAVVKQADEEFPSVNTIKTLLQATKEGLGKTTPYSILTVDENKKVNELNIDQLDAQVITSADLDGGNFTS